MDSNILLRDVPIELLEGKTILLTGASGVIGTHFLYAFDKIYKRGVDINVIATGRSFPLPHLTELFKKPFVRYYEMDLTSPRLGEYFNSVDTIIHCATYGQPDKFIKNPIDTITLNTFTTIKLLEKLHKGDKFLFVSSSELYSGLPSPHTEDMRGIYDANNPRAPYIESKRCGEIIVNAFREKGIDAKSARISLAYGEGTRKNDSRVLSEFIRQAITTGEIRLRDKGRAIRTYCYVGDAVNMMLRIFLEGKQSLYNIGGIDTVHISSLAALIGKITQADVHLPVKDDTMSDAPTEVRSSIERYESEFGKKNFMFLEEGLEKTIKYQQQLYAEEIKDNNQ